MKIIALFLVGMTVFSCSYNNDMRSQLVGKWEGVHDENYYVEFSENGSYCIYFNGEKQLEYSDFSSLFFTVDENLLIPELTIKNSKDELFFRGIFQLQDNELITAGLKRGENINHHIDELSVYRRKGSRKASKRKKENVAMAKYFIPENYRGTILVIHDTKDGVEPELDQYGNEIFIIPNTGILKVKSPPHPFKIAKGETAFYLKRGKNKLVELNILKELSPSQNDNDVYVRINGYNQVARDKVNAITNFSTDSNVLFFTIDSLEHLKNKKIYDYLIESFNQN